MESIVNRDCKKCDLFQNMRNIKINQFIKCLTVIISILFLTSCIAEIDPSAANSISAIIAVIGEYVFAILVLIFCLISRLIRIAGSATVTFALYMLWANVNLDIINSNWLLAIGMVLIIISFFIPEKIYKPHVIISKYAGKQKSDPQTYNRMKGFLCDFFIGLLVGIVLLNIEYFVFHK